MPPTPGRAGGPGAEFSDFFLNFGFLILLWKTCFLERFLRIHPVQSVINSIAQLSGRGFPHIFYMELVLSQLSGSYIFLKQCYGCMAAISAPMRSQWWTDAELT